MHIRHSFQTYLKCHGQIFQMFSTTQATTTETAAADAITAENSKKNDTKSNRYTCKCCKNVCLDLIVSVLFFFCSFRCLVKIENLRRQRMYVQCNCTGTHKLKQ